jgi:ArsR family transcriptional regulator
MDQLAALYKALSEETRLRVLALLTRHGELCVCDVEAALGATQSKTSRHMRYLARAGLVQDRRDGVRILYRLAEDPAGDRARVLDGVRGFAEEPWRCRDDEERLRTWRVRKGLPAEGDLVALG